MEILQRKMQGDTVRYRFFFIERQNAFSIKLKKAERYKYVTLQFPLGGHGDRFTKLLAKLFMNVVMYVFLVLLLLTFNIFRALL